ncbi:hypothetical protein BN59_01294 [Legionella massiliensis]|uniref:Uncharacterized protein n=1 Tax=Legionella massiliensis TaxID=1034943 RepID=A0A078KRH5_9GAMM|nr:hypothetical protein [Legionella massiliensis]CDZ77015.1 hypothetical protein BN59_01294 [Legionella massiliensis]CEE12753.1 hypothetical protein BN1094_01294 [Legionella massiliensis]
MKIYFTTIPGLDPSQSWVYDTKTDRATQALPSDLQQANSDKPTTLPVGITIENQQLVIKDLTSFAQTYPYTTKRPLVKQTSNKLKPISEDIAPSDSSYATTDTFFKTKRSQSNSRSSSEQHNSASSSVVISGSDNKLTSTKSKARIRLKAGDYPPSLLLTDLISSEFNVNLNGETLAYRTLLKKAAEPPRKAHFLRDDRYFIERPKATLQQQQLKVQLLNYIELTLGLINKCYEDFSKCAHFSHEVRKEITDYFCQSIMQSMANGDFKKVQTEYQSEAYKAYDALFRGNQDSHDLFNGKIFALRVEALQWNWFALIDKNVQLNLSTACSLHRDTQEALEAFKHYLLHDSQKVARESIGETLKQMATVLHQSIIFEQEQSSITQEYRKSCEKKEETIIYGYYSLTVLINKLLESHLNPMPHDFHLVIQKDIVSRILRSIILKISANPAFTNKNHGSLVAQITHYSNELYIHADWSEKIKACLADIALEKKFQGKTAKFNSGSLSFSSLDLCKKAVVEQVDQKVYDCLESLLGACLLTVQEKTFKI